MTISKRPHFKNARQQSLKCLVVHNKAHQEKRAELEKEAKKLHDSKKKMPPEGRKAINEKIDALVIRFNKEMNRNKKIDLHWMSVAGAIEFVRETIEKAYIGDSVQIVTGKGIHSKYGVPRIKMELLRVYSDPKRYAIEEDPENLGIVYLAKLLA